MSRPTPPPTGYSGSSTPPIRPAMAEIQSAPVYQPLPFSDFNRKLPPLSIPGHSSPRSDYHSSPTPGTALPSIHSSTGPGPPAHVPRSQPRSYTSQAAPLDKLLSPHPFTPPRSDSNYSPSHSPPRSSVDTRDTARRHERYPSESAHSIHHDRYTPDVARTNHHERYPSDPVRSIHRDQPYASPVEPHRPSYSSISSPASSYTPTFAHSSHYRPVPPPPNVAPPPTSSYSAAAYADSQQAPPPRSLVPATVASPHTLGDKYG
jgi:hypothetical protein